ncbi:dienelactone hydrolase [Chytriomyces sp. MP71]|nr:dienelactone hydrolase [Chytriomyces sp. MP71]
MTISAACVALKAFRSGYEPEGSLVSAITDGHDYYAAPPSVPSTHAVIWVHDIFGVHPNAKQAVDIVSAAINAHVILPDFFRGALPDRSKGREAILAFVEEHSYENHVRDDLINIIKWLKDTKGVTSVGVFGLCWGGRIAFSAGQDSGEEFSIIQAIGTAHPSRLDERDGGKGLRVPVCFLPSSGEDEAIMNSIWQEILSNTDKRVTSLSVHHRYDNMPHGFAGAGNDFSDPAKLAAANDAFMRAATFFNSTL